MPLVVASAMIVVAVFSLTKGDAGVTTIDGNSGGISEVVGYGLTFILGVYGGLFSGGYVALLTATLASCFRFTFLESIALTKVLNLFSSLAATTVFAVRSLIDRRLGLILGAASFGGGICGASIADLSNRLLRREFLLAVIALAINTLIYDVRW